MPYIPAYWQAVGIETQLNILEREAMYAGSGKISMKLPGWATEVCLEVLLEPRWYFPSSQEANYAIPWALWFRDPAASGAEEPPPAAQQQMQLYNRILATADQEEQHVLMRHMLEIAADQFYVIGISTPPLRYGIVQPNFHNVPGFIPHSWSYPHPAPSNPCQFFIEGE